MAHALVRTPVNDPPVLDVSVDGPDGVQLSDGDLRQLFPGSALTGVRLDRLRECPRVLVRCAGQVVAIATYQKSERELRVPDLGLCDPSDASCTRREIVNALIDGVELACIAAGCRRLVVNPPSMSLAFLERRGYVRVNERCAGGWIEKTIV
jgi:hypothetical protein